MQIAECLQQVLKFRNERDWKQFHKPKDMALSLVLEAAEVLEHFQWKDGAELDRWLQDKKDDVGSELADLLYWVLLMAHDLGIDIEKAFTAKMARNEAKYPVEKSRGKSTKYTEL